MLTQGYFIGQIIDDLATIAGQVSIRNRVNLTDLSLYLENFYRDVLDILLGTKLKNLNEERHNAPGLDLGDEAAGLAFQITAERTSTKVNKTLESVTKEDLRRFPNIRILVVSTKQGQYTIADDHAKRTGFKEEDVWDYRDLCKMALSLPIERVQELHNLVSKSVARVKMELEVSDADGNFATTAFSYLEATPKVELGTLSALTALWTAESDLTAVEIRELVETFAKRLSRLPRVVRELFAILYEEREDGGYGMHHTYWVNDTRIRRKLASYPELKEDLGLLEESGFITLQEPDEYRESHKWLIKFPVKSHVFHLLFTQLVENNKLSVRKPFVQLDFTEF